MRATSLRANLVANYASQIYIALLGIIVVPLYLRFMGADAYGLVGFFAMLQTLFNLLDIGLTPTMARETARFHGGAVNPVSYRQFVRALEGVFIAIALIGGGGMFAGAGTIASHWLHSNVLPVAEVRLAVRLMAVMVALRWLGDLYRGAITGAEQLVWFGRYTALMASARYLGVLAVLKYVGATPRLFFGYQAIIGAVELVGLVVKAYRLLPRVPRDGAAVWSWQPIKPVLRFSLTIAFTSSVWILVTQTDKLVLSKLLPLSTYGYYALAVVVASGITLLSGPVSGAIMPRMAKLEATGDHAGLIRVYRGATQLVCVVALPVSVTLAVFAQQVVWAWTGDATAAASAAPILQLYAIGNGVLAAAAFPYYLQYAKGNLRLHLIGSAVFLVVLIPAVIWMTARHGAVGAAWAWLGANTAYLLLWTPVIHHRLEPGLHLRWLTTDVGAIAAASAVAAVSLAPLADPTGTRVRSILVALGSGMIVLAVALASSSLARERLSLRVHAWRRQTP